MKKMLGTCVAAAVIAVGAPLVATATAVVGATEPTQILNHVELIASYQNDVERALTQVRQYTALAQQLQSMPRDMQQQLGYSAAALKNFNSANLDQLGQLQNALSQSQNAVGGLKAADMRAYQTLSSMKAAGQGISVEQYQMGMATLAQEHADTYGKEVADYKRNLADQQQAGEEIDQIVKNAPGITSEVGGLQNVVYTNGILSKQLSAVNQTLTRGNIVQSSAAADVAQKIADQRASKSCAMVTAAAAFAVPSDVKCPPPANAGSGQ